MWAALAAVGIALAGAGGVALAWGAIMLPPAGWSGAVIGSGGHFADDHPVQQRQRRKRRPYRLAAGLFVVGSALQIVAVVASVATSDGQSSAGASTPAVTVEGVATAWEVLGVSYFAWSGRGLDSEPVHPSDLDAALVTGLRDQIATVHYIDPSSRQPTVLEVSFGRADASQEWWTECLRKVVVGESLPTCAW